MADQNKSSKLGLGMLIGVITGAVAGLFLAPKSGKKLRTDVFKRAKEIRKKIEDNNVEETVQNIFNEVSDTTITLYNSAKDMLAEKLAEVTETVSKIDKEKYVKVVNDVISTVKNEKHVAEETLVKLRSYLEDDFDKLTPIKTKTTKPKKKVKKSATKKSTAKKT